MDKVYKDKFELAEEFRRTTLVKPKFTPEYESFGDLVKCEDAYITTSEGESHFYIITPKEEKQIYPLYINMHGGGFVIGHGKKDELMCNKIAALVGCKVINIDFKLAPEYPYPTVFNESYGIVKWVFQNADKLNIDKSKIVLGGQSAGGNLTTAIALRANKTKDFKLKKIIMDYAGYDFATDPYEKLKSEENAEEFGRLIVEKMKQINSLVFSEETDKYNPYLSTLFATKDMLFSMPPALMIIAGKDFLRFESKEFALKLINAGVEVTIKEYLNSNHGFVEGCQGEYLEAQELIVKTLKEEFYLV